MKNTLIKGLSIALLHIAIVLSLAGKLLYDRAHYPRVWVRAAPVDPDLPIRGRYITMRLRVQAPWFETAQPYAFQEVRLAVENNQLVAFKSEEFTGVRLDWRLAGNSDEWALDPPVAFFIPEHAQVPLPFRPGEELWAEVTVPGNGPPRPIQLANKRGQEWQPLNLRSKQLPVSFYTASILPFLAPVLIQQPKFLLALASCGYLHRRPDAKAPCTFAGWPAT